MSHGLAISGCPPPPIKTFPPPPLQECFLKSLRQLGKKSTCTCIWFYLHLPLVHCYKCMQFDCCCQWPYFLIVWSCKLTHWWAFCNLPIWEWRFAHWKSNRVAHISATVTCILAYRSRFNLYIKVKRFEKRKQDVCSTEWRHNMHDDVTLSTWHAHNYRSNKARQF